MGYSLKQRILNTGNSNDRETVKEMSVILVMGEMQIKTTFIFHVIPIRIANIDKIVTAHASEDVNCWRKCKFVQPLWISV